MEDACFTAAFLLTRGRLKTHEPPAHSEMLHSSDMVQHQKSKTACCRHVTVHILRENNGIVYWNEYREGTFMNSFFRGNSGLLQLWSYFHTFGPLINNNNIVQLCVVLY